MIKRTILASTLLAFGLLTQATPAQAAESCRPIQASASGQDYGDGTADATLSDGGLLQGTAHTVFAPTSFDDTYFYFVGTVTFAANKGTLVVDIGGSFNLKTGAFVAYSTDMTGTGKLAGAHGDLELNGVEDPSGHFTESITATLCVDLAK